MNEFPILVTGGANPEPQEDLNLGTLRFVFQTLFPVSFATAAELSGNYLFIGSATTVVIIDVSNPFGPFLAGSVSIFGAPFSFYNSGNYLFYFNNGRLGIIDISSVASPVTIYYPTAGAGNVGSGAFGDVAGEFLYTVRGSASATFQVSDISDPSAPFRRGSASTAVLTTGCGCVYDNGVVYQGTASSIQAFDVSDPDNVILLSTLNTSLLTENITRIDKIATVGSFLYCHARSVANAETYLMIVNKNDPTNLVIESITQIGAAADGYSPPIFGALSLFFPFVGINVVNPNFIQEVWFYDVRQFDAPELKQIFTDNDGGSTFFFSILGNNFYTVGFGGVVSYILFGTNVSNAVVATFTAGTGNVLGEIRAGKATIVGPMNVRNELSAGGSVSSEQNIHCNEGASSYKTRDILRMAYILNSGY